MMLHSKYKKSTLSGSTEDFLRLSYEKIIGPGARLFFGPGDHHLNKLVRGPLAEAT